MSDDLRQLLHATATPPTRPVDAPAVVRRARRQRWIGRAAASAVALVAVLGVVTGMQALRSPAAPPIADAPPDEPTIEPTISVLEQPREPEDAIPEAILEQLELADRWAATSRLARRTADHAYYVYEDQRSEAEPAQLVCLLVVPHEGNQWGSACSARGGTGTIVTVSIGSELLAGVVRDGIEHTAGLDDRWVDRDLPVVNNVFTTESEPAGTDDAGAVDPP